MLTHSPAAEMTVSSSERRVCSALGVAIVIEPDTRRLLYCYNLDRPVSRHCPDPHEEADMVFDMLCEVGEPWIERFERLLLKFSIKPERFENSIKVYDRVQQLP